MKPVKDNTPKDPIERRGYGGGSVFGKAGMFSANRQMEADQKKKKVELEAAIAAAKGTPAAKALVQEYKSLMQAMNLA